MRLAGEIADGVILNWCPPERVPFARARIAEGAEATERDPASVMVAVYVRAWVGPDETEAMSALRAMAGQYASYRAYRRQFDEVGLGPQAAVAGQAHRAGRPEDVPEVLVRAVCAVGVRRGIVSRRSARPGPICRSCTRWRPRTPPPRSRPRCGRSLRVEIPRTTCARARGP